MNVTMTTADWSKIKYFKPSEFNKPERMNFSLIMFLEVFRELCGKPVIIHSSFREGDSGQHGLGNAVDIHVKEMNVVDQYLLAEKTGLFNGIGVYPNWNNPGLHLDVRKGSPARWGCWQVPIYVPLDYSFFKKLYMKEQDK